VARPAGKEFYRDFQQILPGKLNFFTENGNFLDFPYARFKLDKL